MLFVVTPACCALFHASILYERSSSSSSSVLMLSLLGPVQPRCNPPRKHGVRANNRRRGAAKTSEERSAAAVSLSLRDLARDTERRSSMILLGRSGRSTSPHLSFSIMVSSTHQLSISTSGETIGQQAGCALDISTATAYVTLK
jgi:hypothetical protein